MRNQGWADVAARFRPFLAEGEHVLDATRTFEPAIGETYMALTQRGFLVLQPGGRRVVPLPWDEMDVGSFAVKKKMAWAVMEFRVDGTLYIFQVSKPFAKEAVRSLLRGT